MDPNVPGQDRGKSRLQHSFKPQLPGSHFQPFSGNLTQFPGTPIPTTLPDPPSAPLSRGM